MPENHAIDLDTVPSDPRPRRRFNPWLVLSAVLLLAATAVTLSWLDRPARTPESAPGTAAPADRHSGMPGEAPGSVQTDTRPTIASVFPQTERLQLITLDEPLLTVEGPPTDPDSLVSSYDVPGGVLVLAEVESGSGLQQSAWLIDPLSPESGMVEVATGYRILPGGSADTVLVQADEDEQRLTEYRLTGEPTGAQYRWSGDQVPRRGTTAGLLVVSQSLKWKILDPAGKPVGLAGASFQDATVDLLAYCTEERLLGIVDLTAAELWTEAEGSQCQDLDTSETIALDPEGRWVASVQWGTGSALSAVMMLNLVSLEWSLMPGTPASGLPVSRLSWNAGWLLLDSGTQISAWPPGWEACELYELSKLR